MPQIFLRKIQLPSMQPIRLKYFRVGDVRDLQGQVASYLAYRVEENVGTPGHSGVSTIEKDMRFARLHIPFPEATL